MGFSRCLFKGALKDLYEALCHIFSDMSTFSKVSITFKSRSIFKIINPGHLTVAFLPRPSWRIRGESIVALVPHGARPTQRLDCGLCTTSG